MFRRLAPLALILLAAPLPAAAQNLIRIPTCGTATPPAGASPGYMDATGNQCSSATLSGGTITANTSAVAGSAAPSYSAGAQNLSQTLRGGLRMQPSIGGTDLALGQQLSAASLPVVLPSDWSLPAGSNIIGNVRIDQTTPGTTNNVTVSPITATGTGCGATLTTAATAYQVIANGTTRKKVLLQNANTNGANVYFSLTSATPVAGASDTYVLFPGGSYSTPDGITTTTAIYATASANSSTITCTYFN